MREITRRDWLAGSSAAAAIATSPAWAAAPQAGKQGPGFYRMRVGSFELTALYDGTWFRKIDDKFVRNASAAEVDAALTDAFLPPRIVPTSFTAMLVNTGSKLVLIDTGSAGQIADSAGTLLDNLRVAGVAPANIDTILISHFHPDHINGLRGKDGEIIFPNAEVMVPEPEWNFWMDEANLRGAADGMTTYFLNSRRIFTDIRNRVTRFTPGSEVSPGILSLEAFGHTPGHTAYLLSSGTETLMVLGDITNHPWLFARHPEWQGSFDMDGALAVETRRRMLDRAAFDRTPVHGYHFPFPAIGNVMKIAGGYDIAPAMWRPL